MNWIRRIVGCCWCRILRGVGRSLRSIDQVEIAANFTGRKGHRVNIQVNFPSLNRLDDLRCAQEAADGGKIPDVTAIRCLQRGKRVRIINVENDFACWVSLPDTDRRAAESRVTHVTVCVKVIGDTRRAQILIIEVQDGLRLGSIDLNVGGTTCRGDHRTLRAQIASIKFSRRRRHGGVIKRLADKTSQRAAVRIALQGATAIRDGGQHACRIGGRGNRGNCADIILTPADSHVIVSIGAGVMKHFKVILFTSHQFQPLRQLGGLRVPYLIAGSRSN